MDEAPLFSAVELEVGPVSSLRVGGTATVGSSTHLGASQQSAGAHEVHGGDFAAQRLRSLSQSGPIGFRRFHRVAH